MAPFPPLMFDIIMFSVGKDMKEDSVMAPFVATYSPLPVSLRSRSNGDLTT